MTPKRETPVGRGAVLYDDHADGRGLCHVTAVYEESTTGDLLFKVWDGTHTAKKYVPGVDALLAEYTPAGWSFPIGKKPTYFLTREIGVYDRNDLMLEENR